MEVIKLTKENFENEVKKSDKPILVDFYADWCLQRRMTASRLARLMLMNSRSLLWNME